MRTKKNLSVFYLGLERKKLDYYADVYWDRGRERKINQDSLVLLQALTLQGRVLMAAVCDGMGGLDMGETASGYLTEELITWFYDVLLDAVGKKKPLWVIRRSMERLVYRMQRRIGIYAEKHDLSLGSTMSLLVLWEKRYLLWHLGDSRIYRLYDHKRSKIKLLTKDHTKDRNELTKCIGSFGFFLPDFKMGTIRKREAFLLCSDGFWHTVKTEEIAGTFAPSQMREENIQRRLREIGEAAMRRGERDNLSAVYVKIK